MKYIIAFCSFFILAAHAQAQDFAGHLSTARTAYTGGKLEDARFAMQQMMQELDIIAGKDIMALLPQKLDTMNVVGSEDNVSGTSGFAGVVIHRAYGTPAGHSENPGSAALEIITNSPMISTLNGILSLPLLGNNPDQKVVKIAGYKALVQKVENGSRTDFELQLPLNNTLISLKAPGYNQDTFIALAGSLPIAEIAKRVQ